MTVVFQINSDLIKIPEFPQSCLGVIWDIWPPDKNVFMAYDDKSITTYVFVPESVHGMRISTLLRIMYASFTTVD